MKQAPTTCKPGRGVSGPPYYAPTVRVSEKFAGLWTWCVSAGSDEFTVQRHGIAASNGQAQELAKSAGIDVARAADAIQRSMFDWPEGEWRKDNWRELLPGSEVEP